MSESVPDGAVDPGTDVAVAQGDELSALRNLYDPSLDFRKLALEAAYFSRGFRLVEKAELIGVPFIVINATYREGFLSPDKKVLGDYVSLECVVADRDTLDSPQVRALMRTTRPDKGDLLTVYPNEPVVINDGGTGIRRAITELLIEDGMVDPGGDKNDPRRADRPFSQWKSGADQAQYGIEADSQGRKFRYVAMRGLRVSEYESDFGPATTYYFG